MEFNLFSGLIGLVIFVLDVWAIAQIINARTTTGSKIFWVALVAILPVVGLVIWYMAGPKSEMRLPRD